MRTAAALSLAVVTLHVPVAEVSVFANRGMEQRQVKATCLGPMQPIYLFGLTGAAAAAPQLNAGERINIQILEGRRSEAQKIWHKCWLHPCAAVAESACMPNSSANTDPVMLLIAGRRSRWCVRHGRCHGRSRSQVAAANR